MDRRKFPIIERWYTKSACYTTKQEVVASVVYILFPQFYCDITVTCYCDIYKFWEQLLKIVSNVFEAYNLAELRK